MARPKSNGEGSIYQREQGPEAPNAIRKADTPIQFLIRSAMCERRAIDQLRNFGYTVTVEPTAA
jgi:hypothetical protein